MLEISTEVLQNALLDLGLNQIEASAYQAALLVGSRPASAIARTARINRAHIYQVLSSLSERGLIDEVSRNGVKHFTPRPPEVVLEKLESLANRIRGSRVRLESALPDITRLQSRSKSQSPSIQYIQGRAGIERAWEDALLQADSEVRVFLAPKSYLLLSATSSKTWIRSLLKKVEQDGVDIYALSAEPTIIPAALEQKNISIKPLTTISFDSDLVIKGSRIYILASEPSLKGIIFENASFASTLSAIHQLAWTIPMKRST